MKRPPAIPETDELLNLPLEPPRSAPPADSVAEEAFQQEAFHFEEPAAAIEPAEEQEQQPVQRPEHPPALALSKRFEAGLLDLGASISALLVAVLGAWLLGAQLRGSAIPALVSFVASFSFLYHVVPLTFWGQTPGMAVAGLVARAHRDQPLTIQQAVLRWLGAAVTLMGLGLPFLLARSGRSLADRLSRCEVRPTGEVA